MKVQISGEGGYIVSASRREFPGSKSHWPNDLPLGVVKRDGSIDVWPAPYGTETRGSKPPPGWHATAERLLNSPAARSAILAGLKKYRKETKKTGLHVARLSDGRHNAFSTSTQASAWGLPKLKKMSPGSAMGLFHGGPSAGAYRDAPHAVYTVTEYGHIEHSPLTNWAKAVAKHERGDNPRTQEEHFTHAHAKSAGADETMLNLLYGPNPITDDELRKLIAKRPHVYGKYAVYLGKRGSASKHERGGNPSVSGRVSSRRAAVIERSYRAIEKAREAHDPKRFKRGGGYTPEEQRAIARAAGLKKAPSNLALGRLELHRFVSERPAHLFAYYKGDSPKSGEAITSFTGERLGHVVSTGSVYKTGSGYPRTRMLPVRVKAITGDVYSGVANLDTGTYVKLKKVAGKASAAKHESGGNPRTSRSSRSRTAAPRSEKPGSWESYFERVVEALRGLGLRRSHADEYASLIRSSWATAKPVRTVALTLKAYEQGDAQALAELRRPPGVSKKTHSRRESAADAVLRAKLDAVLGKK